jgi:hypothetical protein
MSTHVAAPRRLFAFVAAAALVVLLPGIGSAREHGPWGTAVLETAINSPQADGCPIETFDGLTLYFASTRPGALGGATDPNDIWRISRPSIGAPWGTAVHLPAPVNSASADFCPTPLPGKRLYFVSARGGEGSCGAGDIYRTREHPVKGWLAPVNLGCAATGSGPNFAGGEFSPSLFEAGGVTYLYFSSTGSDGLDQDIYVSRERADGSFTAPSEVPGLNTAGNDQMPNVSRDGREIVFVSDRPGGAGALDVYTATRASVNAPWSAPVGVGGDVNTAAAESRPSLSGDGHRLHFGRLGDIWVSTRD